MSDIKHIALLMAMQDEAQPIIEALGLQPKSGEIDENLPMTVYSSCSDGMQVSVILSGQDERYGVDYIGTQAATLSAYTVIRDMQPDILISAGTAGGFSERGADIGTVYLSDEKFVFHDRRVPLPGFDESSVGHYPAFNVRNIAAELKMPYGIVSSGSSLEKADKDVEVIEQYSAVAKEMEAAAIAWVSWLHNKPFFAIKSITNLLDKPGASEEQFVENLVYSSLQLQIAVQKVIAYMKGKSLSELSSD